MLQWNRMLLVAAAAVLLAVPLAACGSKEGDAGGSGSAAIQAAPIANKPETRKYDTVKGAVEIPVEPKRIVATQYLGHLLTLGVKPVGAGSASLKQHFLKEMTEGIADIGDDAAALEKIAELNPDLIIRPSDKNYEQFSKIAPTVVIPWGQKDVMDELRDFGDMLGKKAEAEAAIERFEAKAAEAKQKLAGVVGPGETVGVYEIWAKSFWAVSQSFGRGTRNLYTSLGLSPPEPLKKHIFEKGGSGLDMSLEVLPQYAADHMFVTVYAANGGDKRAEEIWKSDLWKSLPAVKNNRVYMLDIDQFAAADLISMEKQLDIQVQMLLSRQTK
ncbi:ABC transporter substrate-binding protein [Paenibacillus sp. GYB003]|uniref:ABC transporter substrate-binding protein n=1 Tax=Paenibacillus sp. GYB003 TaxID=2994392 RepID=UPI002F965CB9